MELDSAGTVERGENRHQHRRDKCKGVVTQKRGVTDGREVARGKRGREDWAEWMMGKK